MQTGRVYDYAFFILAGLFTAFLLIDFVIDPTGAAFLAESAALFHKSSTTCSSFAHRLLASYRAPAGWLAGRAKTGPRDDFHYRNSNRNFRSYQTERSHDFDHCGRVHLLRNDLSMILLDQS